MYCDRCGSPNRDDARYCHGCGADLAGQRADLNSGPGADLSLQEVGAVIGNRYRIEKEIGRGGMGIVYKAFDQELQMPVAIKVLHPRVADRPEAVTQLREEALAAMRLTHPNIVRLHNFENTAQAKYLLMEHVAGQSLAKMLTNGLAAGFTERDVIRIAQEICDGLGAAHKAGVIHRDIKPSNIMLTPEGQVKILDFGIARAQGLRLYQGPRTTGAGTPTYMAPEQFRGDKVDGRTDVYAVGATLYEVLASHPPFVGNDLKRQHLEDRPEPIPGVSEWLNEIILKCLEKDPRARWQNVEALRTALDGNGAAVTGGLRSRRQTDNEPEWRRVSRERERRAQMIAADRAAAVKCEADVAELSPPSPGPPRVLKPEHAEPAPPASPVTPGVIGGPGVQREGGLVQSPGAAATASRPGSRPGRRPMIARRFEKVPGSDIGEMVWQLPPGVLQFAVGAMVLLAIAGVGTAALLKGFGTTGPALLLSQVIVGGVLGAYWGLAEVETRKFLLLMVVGLATGLVCGFTYVAQGITPDTTPLVVLSAELVRALVIGGALGAAMGIARGVTKAAVLASIFSAAGGVFAAGFQLVARLQNLYGDVHYVELGVGLALFGFLTTVGAAIGANLVRAPHRMRL